MKILAKRKQLADAFNAAAMFCPRKMDMPILQCVKLVANGKTTLIATDMEASCQIELPPDAVQVNSPGEALLYPDRFGALLKEMQDDEIRIEQAKQRVTITSNRGKFVVDSEPVANYPSPKFSDCTGWTVDAAALRTGVSRVAFAADENSKNYALGSVLFSADDNGLNLVATDGRTLAHQVIGCRGTFEPASLVIPRTPSVQKIARNLPQTGDATVGVVGNELVVHGDGYCYSARLLEGLFPRWRDVFPRGGEAVAVRSGDLISIIKQMAIVASRDEVNGNRLDFLFNADSVGVKVAGSERGEGELDMPASFQGKPVSVLMNHHFVLPWLMAVGPDVSVEITPGNGESAVVLNCPELSARYVIMPVTR